jgi:hypothetical protein
VKSVRPINERESSSWPTPTSRDWEDGGKVPPSRGADKVSRQTLPQRLAYIGQQDPTNPSSSGKNQGSWATPNTMDSLPQKSEETLRRQAQTVRKGRKKPSNLREQVDPKALEIYKEESKQWPTARVSDVEGGRIKTEITDKGFRSKREKSDQWFGAKLRDAVETHEENWPTPTVMEAGKIGNNPNFGQQGLSNHPSVHGRELDREKLHKDKKGKEKAKSPTPKEQTSKKLNANWVEHLMGLPPQWTQLPTEWID